MKVYIVESGDFDGSQIQGVFKSEDDAKDLESQIQDHINTIDRLGRINDEGSDFEEAISLEYGYDLCFIYGVCVKEYEVK